MEADLLHHICHQSRTEALESQSATSGGSGWDPDKDLVMVHLEEKNLQVIWTQTLSVVFCF